MDEMNKLAAWCKVATPHNVVYNSECVYTFYTPYHHKGILVNLQNFIGACDALAHKTLDGSDNSSAGDNGLFVRIVKERTLKQQQEEQANIKSEDATSKSATTATAPTKLGVGVEGGFASPDDKYHVTTTYSVVRLTNDNGTSNILQELPFTSNTKNDFATMIAMSVDSVVHHAGSAVQQDLKAWELDDEPLKESKYAAGLMYVDNGVAISPNPADWKCQKSNRTDHVWLNLSTGYMGGGRAHWDGSGGSNGALDHYNDTQQLYPLVVKLGTITADPSTADCYSYAKDEDGPVQISNLVELLTRRGIHVASL
jgi:ubiquitin carboxyl-terminal hydrolase 5/13